MIMTEANNCCGTTADKAKLLAEIEQLKQERDEAQAYAERVRECVTSLIDNSNGVSGLHLNGDIATWDELTEGGRFEEWLMPLSEQPPASLSALKAEWQAEAASEVMMILLRGYIFHQPKWFTHFREEVRSKFMRAQEGNS